MGQEASLPADGDDLEELAPPSHTTAAAGQPSPLSPSGGGGKNTSKVPQKMLNMMRAFEQSARGDDSLQKMESTDISSAPANGAGNTNHTTTSSTKASLFRPTVAARGVISQMRSLRISNKQSTVEKQKAEHAQDWEKQWYADDDDDDSDEEDDTTTPPAGGGGGGYNNTAAAAVAAAAAIPPSTGGIVTTPTNAAIARPLLDPGPHSNFSSTSISAHLVTPPDPSSTRGASSQILAYSDMGSNQHHQHHAVHMQPDEVFNGIIDPFGKKPDVSMFLPMLRVLGKGSFGKVRLR